MCTLECMCLHTRACVVPNTLTKVISTCPCLWMPYPGTRPHGPQAWTDSASQKRCLSPQGGCAPSFQSATFLDLALTLPRALWPGQLPRLWVCGGEKGRGSGLLPSSPHGPLPPVRL